MPLFKNRDIAGDAPKYGVKGVSTANGYSLFQNNTPIFTSDSSNGQTVSIIGVTPAEAAANKSLPGTGWVLVRQGTGGRAGRVSYELLAAIEIKSTVNGSIIVTSDSATITADSATITADNQ